MSRLKSQSGQVLIEYALMLVICALIAATLLILAATFGRWGDFTMKLVGVDAP